MKNRASHSLRERFSGECCVKNTQVPKGRIMPPLALPKCNIYMPFQWLISIDFVQPRIEKRAAFAF